MKKCIECKEGSRVRGSLLCESCQDAQFNKINAKHANKKMWGDVDMREKVRKLLDEDLNGREIAEKLGVTTATVYYHRNKILEEKEVAAEIPNKKESTKKQSDALTVENKRLQRELDKSIAKVKELDRDLSDEKRASNNTIKMLKKTIEDYSDENDELRKINRENGEGSNAFIEKLKKENKELRRKYEDIEQEAVKVISENKEIAKLERKRHDALYNYITITNDVS